MFSTSRLVQRAHCGLMLLALPITITSCREKGPPPLPTRAPQPFMQAEGRFQQAESRLQPSPGSRFQLESQVVTSNAPDQKVVRSGELHVEVRNAETAARQADSLARRHGGLMADMRIAEDDHGRHTANLVLRIPTDQFSQTLQDLRALGSVKSETISQEDVTRTYTDLEARLSVKEQTAASLRQLLANRTGKLSDVLEVERELSRVVTEIEQLKGQRKYYDSQIAMSSVTIMLFEAGAGLPGSGPSVVDAFRHSIAVLTMSVSWLVYAIVFVVPWLALVVILWWVTRWIRGRKAT